MEVLVLGDPATSANLANVTAGGALKTDASATTQPVSGTVTANAGTNLNTSALALDSTVSGLEVAQGSTTSGQKGILELGAVTTAAPSYTTAQTSPLSLNTSGGLRVDGSGATQPVSGTVTANAGTNLNTSALALDTSVNGLLVAQGSTTSGEKGPLAQGAVTTAAPAYTTAQTSPLSLNTSGGLRVDGSGATQPVSGTVSVNALPTGSNTIGKVDILGNAGAAMDAAQNAAAPANELVAGGVYNTTIPALSAGNATQLQTDSTGSLLVNIEGRKKTYSAFATFTPVAGDIALIPGNGTTTARVTRVEVSLSTTGTAGIEAVQLVKRSAADTAGTSASMTAVPHDSNFAAANSAPLSYTAAPTPGAAVGTIRGLQFFDESATVTGANTWLWEFGTRGGASAIVLRGTAQQLCVNLGGVVATQTATVSYEWVEE
jgi:hypothetical protein